MKDDDEIIEILQDNNRANELKITFEIFDKDGDGKLNAEERKNADEAVRNVSLR